MEGTGKERMAWTPNVRDRIGSAVKRLPFVSSHLHVHVHVHVKHIKITSTSTFSTLSKLQITARVSMSDRQDMVVASFQPIFFFSFLVKRE